MAKRTPAQRFGAVPRSGGTHKRKGGGGRKIKKGFTASGRIKKR